jgi:xylose isomerase
MADATLTADVAFATFDLLDLPFLPFHDRDVALGVASLARNASRAQRSRSAAALQPPSVS